MRRAAPSLYVHVPFCVRKCAYCDFASEEVTRERVRVYLDALALEASRSGDTLRAGADKVTVARDPRPQGIPPERAAPGTVYIGGGTPTSLTDAELAELLGSLGRAFDLSRVTEFTVEANPGTVNVARLVALRKLGANRLSLGVQSFRDATLDVLGRIHTAREAEEAYRAAREAGFSNVSLDLIFAAPGQTLGDVLADVEHAVGLAPEHVSLYGLTYEPGTPLRRARDEGRVAPVHEELEREMYLAVIDSLSRAGYVHYEISNFALPGRESKHNSGYWLGREYAGLGPSAASFLLVKGGDDDPLRRRERRTNVRDPGEYASRLLRGEDPAAERERLGPERAAREAAVLGLRLRSGIEPAEFEERTGFALFALLGETGERLFHDGWLEREGGVRVRLSRKALPVADSIFAEIV